MSHIPDISHVSKRLNRILTFRQLHEEMTKWLAARPLRGDMKVMFLCSDSEADDYYVGIVGVMEDTICSRFFPDIDIMRLKGEE